MAFIPEQDTILAYLEGRLTPAEQLDFEARLAASEALAEEVRRFRYLRLRQQHESLLQGRATLQSVMDETPIAPDYGPYAAYFRSGGGFFRRWWWTPVLLLCLGVGAWNYRSRQQQQHYQSLVRAQLQPMPNLIGFAPDDPGNAAQAMRAYDRQQYPEAIRRLEAELQVQPDDNSLRLYLAVSYLLEGQAQRAEPLLRAIVPANDLTAVPARWYLALSLLQQGRSLEARSLLQSLEKDTIFGVPAGALGRAL